MRPHADAKSPPRPARRARGVPAAGRRPVGPEDLGQLRSVSGARVSPDARSVVFAVRRVGDKNDYQSNLWMARRGGAASDAAWTVAQFTSGGKDADPAWTPQGDRIVFISEREKGRPQLYAIPAGGGEAVPVSGFEEGTIGGFRIAPDGSAAAVTFRPTAAEWTATAAKQRESAGLSDPPRVLDDLYYREDGQGYFGAQRFRLYLVELPRTGRGGGPAKPRLVYDRDNLGTLTFDWAPDSRRLVVATDRRKDALWAESGDELLILDTRTGKFRPIPGLPGGCKNSPRWSPDASLIAYAGHTGVDGLYATDNVGIWTCPPEGGSARCLTKATDYCAVGIAITDTAESVFQPVMEWAPDSKSILLQIAWHGCGHIARIPRKGVSKGDDVLLTAEQSLDFFGNTSADGSVIAFTRSTYDSPGEVCIGTPGKDGRLTVERITDLHADFHGSVRLARPRSHWLRAEDGHRVQAWVMEPPGTGKRPAILLIHGGPHAQYGVGFFHEMQALVGAGYVVVFSNPRGSKGYGRAHTSAIRGDWGNKDWEDLRAVLAMMQQHPRIDRKRLGVAGGSYGGYMTNWIVGRSRAFRAAITDRCVSNFVSMGGNSDYPDPEDRYFPGNTWDRPEARWAVSPIKDFGKVRTPLLIIHAEGDLRCNVEQSEQIFSILKMRGVPCRFVRYPRSCSHGMSRSGPPDMRLHRLQQILEWWERWLK